MAYQDAYKECIWLDFATLERFMKSLDEIRRTGS